MEDQRNRGCLWVGIVLSILMAGCACKSEPRQCFISGCDGAKALVTNEAIADELRKNVNEPLNLPSRAVGFLTTTLGKNCGIHGWVDLHRHADVEGKVIQVAYSTDKFYTVDMQIESILLDRHPLTITGERYIRAEICINCVPLAESDRPLAGDRVRLSGKLKWDADGFLEVHPQQISDVEIIERSGRS